MKKFTKTKGFTLIELLAVIAIISLISVIIIPNITKTSIRTKENLYKTKVKNIIKAKKMCEQDGEDDCDVIGVLLAKKYLVGDNGSNCNENCLKNPIDGTYMDNCFVTYNGISCSNRAENAVKKIKKIVKDEPDDTLDVITKTAPEGSTCTNTLAYDGTGDNNLRYVGADPCNYITFNNEVWRIIGVMNNINNGAGTIESRLKIIRKRALGSYSWNSSESGGGSNDWSKSKLMLELNGDYLDTNLTENTKWYNGVNHQKTATFYENYVLKEDSQSKIENAKWNTGSFTRSLNNLIPKNIYNLERGTDSYSNHYTCTDDACPRTTEWTGKVGLIYPSDYGFATSGGSTPRKTCIEDLYLESSTAGSYWNCSDCYTNDWLKLPSSAWTLSPMIHSTSANTVFTVLNTSSILSFRSASFNMAVYPVVYLKADVTMTSGDGSPENPYTLG